METPSSTRRVTRSQTLAAMNSCGGHFPLSSKEAEESVNYQTSKCGQRRKKERSAALIDITNDSPIVGVAMETPASGVTAKKKNRRIKRTPGSGEALLRGQVKTLLQKVEEEAELTKISTVTRLPFLHFLTSPMGLVAPTPANTPQLDIVIASPVVEEHLRSSQEVVDGICEGKDESLEALKSLSITRSLLLDFSDKSESSDSLSAEDESSVWSMQVNASTRDEDDDDDDDEDQVSCYQGEEEEEEEGLLCEGIRKMSMVESDKKTKAEFAGKHTRFVYDSEGEEIVEEQTLGVLRLKGLPTPKGKHFRFDAEEEEEDTVSNS